ncbi:head-tail adaptor protein [Brevundimonas sp.]|uniref:head-tail adaptor protein n=1 Tax=Brevundimonas sp. TaxID=1871086 RepID=UPI0035B37A0C
MRRLGELLEAVETETAQGGRAVSYEPLGVVWLALGERSRSEGATAGQIEAVERLQAVTRMEPRLVAGRVVRLDGRDWRIRLVDPDQPGPGRATLSLERTTR